MNFYNINDFKRIRLLSIIALLIWLIVGLGSRYDLLFGLCRYPIRLNSEINQIYSLITLFTLILMLVFRKHRVAFYILLVEFMIWFFHFLAFRGWPSAYGVSAGFTNCFYYYDSSIYDYMGFFLRIILLTSFCWYERIRAYKFQILVLMLTAGYLVFIKMFPTDWTLAIEEHIIQLHINIFSYFGINVLM